MQFGSFAGQSCSFIGKFGLRAVCGIFSSCRIVLRAVPGEFPGVLLTPVQLGKAAEQLFGLALGLRGVELDCAKAALAVIIATVIANRGNFMIDSSSANGAP